jgi:pimeloyl-ACP methyl ester carboxylesterase
MTVQQIRVDGVDIAYTETGSGPTVLFVHGVYVTGAVWNDVVNELGVGFGVWRRHGRSGRTAPRRVARISVQKRPLAALCTSWRHSIFVMSPWWPMTRAAA